MRILIVIIIALTISSCTLTKSPKTDKNMNSTNISTLLDNDKAVQTKLLFTNVDQKVIVLKIKENEYLKEHISKVTALLVCIKGEAIYTEKNGRSVSMTDGDFVEIPKDVLHEVLANKTSEFLLIK